MDLDEHQSTVEKLINPDISHAEDLLQELGLAELPSREQVHRAIEEKLLLPQDKFPDHWLPLYQV